VRIMVIHRKTLALFHHFFHSSRFYPSEAKSIGDEILKEGLEGREYDEDSSEAWSLDMCNKIRQRVVGFKIH